MLLQWAKEELEARAEKEKRDEERKESDGDKERKESDSDDDTEESSGDDDAAAATPPVRALRCNERCLPLLVTAFASSPPSALCTHAFQPRPEPTWGRRRIRRQQLPE